MVASPATLRALTTSVLHVDDDTDYRMLVRAGLEHAQFDVIEAENGVVGLDRCRAYLPSLILLDLQMPIMDGWGFLTAKEQDSRIASIPVIVLSSHGGDVGPSVVRQLRKPASTAALVSLIRLIAGSARPR